MKFKVTIARISISHITCVVCAEDQVEAEAIALDDVANYEFPNPHTAEYEVTGSTPIA